ncbi:hypothetical protein HDU67_008093, partial [Dinochytrium kinnereticum]
ALYNEGRPRDPPRIFVRGPITEGSVFSNSFGGRFDRKVVEGFGKWKVEVGKYRGWEVEMIDGVKALDAVRSFSDNYIGTARDPEARFHYALHSSMLLDGKLMDRDGRFYMGNAFPWEFKLEKKYVLVHPQTGRRANVTAPWMGVWTSESVESSKTYYKRFCTYEGDNVQTEARRGMEEDESLVRKTELETETEVDVDGFRNHLMDEMDVESRVAIPNQIKPFQADNHMAFYVLPDGVTGVFKLTTFSFDRNFENVGKTWVPNMAKGIKELAKRKVKKLIIDFSGNGAICYFEMAL